RTVHDETAVPTLVVSSSCCVSLAAVADTSTVTWPAFDGATRTYSGASVSPAIAATLHVAVFRAGMHGEPFSVARAILLFVVEIVTATAVAGSDPIERTAPEMPNGRRATMLAPS